MSSDLQPGLNDAFRTRVEELMITTAPRVPVGLCLDVSGSMSGAPLAELNRGVQEFYTACQGHPLASQSAEIAVISFADDAVLESDFSSVANATAPQVGPTRGSTSLGTGVRCTLDRLKAVKAQYQQMGVDYFQPWIVIMTDGAPTDSSHLAVANDVIALEAEGKLVVFPIGIGNADMSALALFSKKRPPLKLQGLKFPEFFEWLAKSIARVSESRPGEAVKLDLSGIGGWGEV